MFPCMSLSKQLTCIRWCGCLLAAVTLFSCIFVYVMYVVVMKHPA